MVTKSVSPAADPLACRHPTPERMDDPGLAPRAHEEALCGLARLNWLGGAVALLWPHIRAELDTNGGEPLRLLDVACGGGDVVRALYRRARGRLECLGVDISDRALEFARRRSPSAVQFARLDALREPLPHADIVTCSLFLHHLSNRDAVTLMRKMSESARRLVIVSELERCRFSLVGVWLSARLVSRSEVVHGDGALSVRAAFKRQELEGFARAAGLEGACVARRFPLRLLLLWRRPQSASSSTEGRKESVG